MKRLFDGCVASAALVMLSPVFLWVAALISLDSGGPVLFKQQRVGRRFRLFTLYKFRTMAIDAPSTAPRITCMGDPRVTRIGRLLRQTKLDELPQLMNVLKGDMSLVGPRPEVPEYVERFREDYRDILAVRPGVTDLASLKYRDEAVVLARFDNPIDAYTSEILPDKLRLAREYIAQASLRFDLLILMRTVVGLLAGSRPKAAAMPEKPERVFVQTQKIALGIRNFITQRRGTVTMSPVNVVFRYRRPLVVCIHLALTVFATYASFWLRFDGAIPEPERRLLGQILPTIVAIRAITFVPFRLYEGLWRYTGIWDLRNIIAAVALSTGMFYLLICSALGRTGYPRSALVIDSIVLIFLMGGIRLVPRLTREFAHIKRERRVLIFGAGGAGEMIVRDMKTNDAYNYEPVGFVDDDPAKLGRRIHGVQVLGGREDLPRIIATEKPHEVLVAIPVADPATLRAIIACMEPFKVPITTLPALGDIVNGKVTTSQIRSLSIEDLLPRAAIGLDPTPLAHLITGRRVLVTGAGGSIGSELSRQIGALKPEVLLLYERYENGLYNIANDLIDRYPDTRVVSLLGDVTDARRLNLVLAEYRPHMIVHAAAHKHVPLVEFNPCEAIKNNVTGTRVAAEAASRHGVELFVFISSDKAVNPSSVMGATKRVAEMIVQQMSARDRTRFVAVRFGNVLASNGSVVPRFVEQIKAGGPVTVTHPDMQRYFMLITEAVQLVLHAAALGEHGGTYVLEMGEQIKLVDLARNVIRLSGYIPDEEIPITFVGCRPGEKLSEELVAPDETIELSPIHKVFRIRPGPRGADLLSYQVPRLERLAARGEAHATINQLCEIVPSFQPGEQHTAPASPSVRLLGRHAPLRAGKKSAPLVFLPDAR